MLSPEQIKTMINSVLVTFILLILEVKFTVNTFQDGYCQVYSYNIHQRGAGIQEKHFFSCCSNMKQKCKGFTYQKPSRTESICSGRIIQQEGSHWTQKEESAFPDNGRFYCGGCCGQHLAMESCNEKLKGQWEGCNNWVQCFQRECRNVVAAILDNQPLKCSIPPAPFPRHYGSQTIPPGLTLPTIPTPLNTPKDQDPQNSTCSATWCKNQDKTTRCRIHCCTKYCCLPDGPQKQNHSIFWGFTTLQVIGIIIGTGAILSATVAIILLISRRGSPRCHNFHHPSDTQILVIEGPDDIESDIDNESPTE